MPSVCMQLLVLFSVILRMGRSPQQECLWQTQPLSPAVQVMSFWETPHSSVKVMEHGTALPLYARVPLVSV